MSGDLDERMGQLCDELQQALDAGQSIDIGKLAERFAIPEPDVQKALQALQAMHDVLGDDAAAHAAELAPPQLSDDYEVLDELGRGGMGVVYRAHQKSLDRDLAVKVLRPGDLMFGDAIRRFEREAKSLAKLRHRHIVSVHEVGKTDGFVYFTMDLIDGCTLAERLENGAMPTTQAVKLLLQVSSAMAYAHGKGVMHRDLKPGNILLDPSGDGFVCDFGLARELGGEAGATMTGQMLGTPGYMAPEQALGDRNKIGEQTDVYALGAILYECLAGKAPFAGLPLAQLMHAVLEQEPTQLRRRNATVPTDLQVIVEKAMAKDPAHRYATVQAFAEDLERFSIGKEILARPPSDLGRALRFAGRHRSNILGAILPVALALLAVWLFVVPALRRDEATDVGQALLEAGNAAGARTVYGQLYVQLPPDEIPIDHRTRYLDALATEAAHLYLFGEGDDTEAADRLRAEAERVVAGSGREKTLGQMVQLPVHRREAHDRARNRVSWLSEGSQVQRKRERLWSGTVGMPETDDNLGIRHFGAFRFLGHGETRVWSSAERDAVLAMLRASHRLPTPVARKLHSLAHGSRPPKLFTTVDEGFLDELVRIAGDAGVPLATRIDAAVLFHRSGQLPFLHRPHGASSFPGSNRYRVDETELQWLGQAWQRLRAADFEARGRLRVDLVAERLAAADPLDATELRQWMFAHTGYPSGTRDPAAWWRENRTTPLRTHLARSLGFDLSQPLRVETVLDTLSRALRRRERLHHLVATFAREHAPVPAFHDLREDTVAPIWRRSFARQGEHAATLRLAVIGFADHADQPTIFWQQRQRLAPGDRAWFAARLPDVVATPALRIDTRALQHTRQTFAGITVRGVVDCAWNANGMVGEGYAEEVDASPFGYPYQDQGGCAFFDAGEVSVLQRFVWKDRDGHRLDLAVLAVLHAEDEATSDWNLREWTAATVGSLARVATMDKWAVLHRQVQLLAASFLPSPTLRAALRSIDATIQAHDPTEVTYLRRAVRLLCGDADAIAAPIPAEAETSYTDPELWARIARTTNDDAIRRFAFEQLEPRNGADLSDGMLRSFARAREQGLALPSWLDAPAEAPRGAFASYVKEEWSTVRNLLLSLGTLLLAVLLLPFVRERWAVVMWSSFAMVHSALLVDTHVLIHGFNVLPSVATALLGSVGAWALCWRQTRGSRWWICACIWTAVSLAIATGLLDYHIRNWLLGWIPVSGFVWQGMRDKRTPRRRRR